MRYRKLAMRTKSASGELNKALQPLFTSIMQAHIIHDDLIIAGKSNNEHNKALDDTLKIIKQSGLMLHPDKCIFAASDIPFWGMRITADGIMPDPQKKEAVKSATPPQSREDVISFLCMIQSNAEFLPGLTANTVNLRKLTTKNARFQWNSKCQKEFEKLKDLFTEDALIRYFDPTADTVIFVDAHQTGLSAILSQGKPGDNPYPVVFAIRHKQPVRGAL